MTTSSSSPVLAARLDTVTKSFGIGSGAVVALDAVSLDIERGRFTAIMGPSGSGKSTLMHIAAGLDSPTSGRVWLGDTEIGALDDAALTRVRRDRMGFIFQSFNLVPTLTAWENIVLPFDLGGRRIDATQRAWITDLCTSLGLGDRLDHRPHQLSGGQQQRVAIIRALATRPEIIFADEPTGALDSRTGREVLSLLADACARFDQTIAMVTHDPIAASYADRIVVLADGSLRHDIGRTGAAEISSLMLSLEEAA
ncbi:ABC transporter ATP-binding protein [Mycetocola lacteus]|uniref:ABC transporter ATP-binding protein n=1 Tax=Mycetocola lacteus TaxID=76637 RepID=A0A3L7ANW3_9MICO|nr:ABC transporter ATP-binding protein [Mycetocola lacteus]RLP82193.1 ABC transporter ATP-binding protein [Mycetocola lacteus]